MKTSTKNRQRLGYQRIVSLLVGLVIIPTGLLLAVGIVAMFVRERFNLLFGLLTVSFVSMLVTGTVLIWVFLRREANLSELQADFVSKVSHELRTPLTAIRLLVETMDRADSPEIQKRCLDALGLETARLTSRIERLLDWGRMEAGRKLYELREESPETIVEETVLAFSPLHSGEASGKTNLSFSFEVAPSLPKVLVDKHAIVDALLNLLSNAQKYGGSPPTVTLRAYENQHGVVFEVRDNGEGIPRIEHRKIFEKFYRVDDRLSRAREGSGLGLAIVKHIAKAHGGRVSVESEAHHGSSFRFILPKAPEHGAPHAA